MAAAIVAEAERIAAEWKVSRPPALVEAGAIRRMAEAIGDPNPLWHDRAAAERAGYRDVVAPPTFVDSLNPFYNGEPYPVWGLYPHSFSAGDRFELFAPICVGDRLGVDCRIARIETRTRSDGVSGMLFVTYLKRYTRAGEHVANELWTCVLFEGERIASAPSHPEPPAWASTRLPARKRKIDADTVARWAAAVGDFERIHIDYRFAVDVSELPGPVAHGPCVAALLTRPVTDAVGPGRIRSAEFRYLAPIYVDDELTLECAADGAPASGGAGRAWLVARREDGSAVTSGIVEWAEEGS